MSKGLFRTVLTVRTIAELRDAVAAYRAEGARVALVPTMGALHAGHMALVEAAKRPGTRIVASIFVNPKQFGAGEDLGRYPRKEIADARMLGEAGCDLLWLPPVEVMYPDGFATTVSVAGVSEGLDGAARPGHFDGVATVVAKLFAQSRADFATFGEKDYQQLQVVTRLARDLDLGTQIIPVPTLRESDGLALSSRNVYLSAADRATAPTLHSVLQATAEAIRSGRSIASAVLEGSSAIKSAGFALDYLEARHASSLDPVASLSDGPIRLLVAAKIGKTRLIDNIAV